METWEEYHEQYAESRTGVVIFVSLLSSIAVVVVLFFTAFDAWKPRSVVPVVVGVSLNDGAREAARHGFQLEIVGSLYDPIVPKGWIVKQEPLAGKSSDEERIRIRVSKGREPKRHQARHGPKSAP